MPTADNYANRFLAIRAAIVAFGVPRTIIWLNHRYAVEPCPMGDNHGSADGWRVRLLTE